MRKKSGILIAGGGLIVMSVCCNTGTFNNLVFEPLEFPFANVEDIARMAAFGIPNWSGSEPHNGIDLVVDEHLESASIISPTAGVVTRISTNENPYSHPPGQLLLTLVIRINNDWSVHLVLEPGTTDPALEAAQLDAILVSEGQDVEVGTPVADLMVGALGYPHLHYMVEQDGEAVCAYAHSSDAARAAFESVSVLPGSSLPDGNICYGQP
jgi:murein DD-endopeptidase MepM/ murein hydrolase activator NlpD